ncbi:15857_t:CDS:2, partial [Funneliformis geosporum]
SLKEFSEEELNNECSEGERVENKDNKLSESEEKQKNILKNELEDYLQKPIVLPKTDQNRSFKMVE